MDLGSTHRALLKVSTNKEATWIRGWGRASERGDEARKSVVEFRLEGGLWLELEAAENINEAQEGWGEDCSLLQLREWQEDI